MKRISELIEETNRRYPNDNFFLNFNDSLRTTPNKEKYYRVYNEALMVLDDESWQILKEKALRHFLDHREGQRKQGFFNILNEAFAYRYLVSKGYENVRCREDTRVPSPDIEFIVNNKKRCCEVKTSNISDDEIDRREKIGVVYDTYKEYGNLNELFFANKLPSIINKAEKQLNNFINNNFIFIIIIFDDFTLEFKQTYKERLISFLNENKYHNLIIKMGLDSEELSIK
jgi:hypothetical protein